jgi:hypothetical protein
MDIYKYDSKMRKKVFQVFLDEVLLPQRQRLIAWSNEARQSAQVDPDGHIAQLIASIVSGVPGTGRKGKSGANELGGDLLNKKDASNGYKSLNHPGWEVKATFRAEQMQDIKCNVVNANDSSITLDSNASPIDDFYKSCTIDIIAGTGAGKSYKAMSNNAYDGTTKVLKIGQSRRLNPVLDNTSVVQIRKQDGHFNFGDMTRKQMKEFVKHEVCILVHYGYDTLGRFKIEVLQLDMTNPATKKIMVEDFYKADANGKPRQKDGKTLSKDEYKGQFQPRLYPDGERGRIQEYNGRHGRICVRNLGAKVIAKAVEKRGGADIEIWCPDAPKSIDDTVGGGLLTIKDPTSFESRSYPLPADKRKWPEVFFRESMVEFYRGIEHFCDITSSTKNMTFANLAQHLVSLVTGFPGSGSNARGMDLVVNGGDGEVKLATGYRGDDIGSMDLPRLNLGNGHKKMLNWVGIFPVRIVFEGGLIKTAVFIPGKNTMNDFYNQVRDYFYDRGAPKSPLPPNLQYHATKNFKDDFFGNKNHLLHFKRAAEFIE